MNKKMNRNAVYSLVVVAGMMLCALKANAQAVTSAWSSAVSGSWDDGSKWDKGSPLAGTNALIGATGANYVVAYTNSSSARLGAVTVFNSTGATNELHVSALLDCNGIGLSNSVLLIKDGACITNRGIIAKVGTAYRKIIMTGGNYFTSAGFGDVALGDIVPFDMSNGVFVSTTLAQRGFGAKLTMSGGFVSICAPYSGIADGSVISGGVFTNSGTSFTLTSSEVKGTGRVILKDCYLGGNGETWRVNGGELESADTLSVGANSYTGSRSGLLLQSNGWVTVVSTNGLYIGGTCTGGQTLIANYRYRLCGGVLNLKKMVLSHSSFQGVGLNQFEMVGGTLNLGAGGIVFGNAPNAVTNRVTLSGGTINATTNWAMGTSLEVVITNTGVGAITFCAANTNGVPYDVAIPNAMRGNGRLTKTGTGALLLNGLNTYTGLTAVVEGTLGGTGSVASVVNIASNAFVSGGSTTAVGTLTMTNLVMQEGAGLMWNYGTATRDSVVVAGALTLATNAVVNVSAAEGATSSQLPASSVLMTYTSSSGATSLNGWVVNGLLSARVKLDVSNKQVLLLKNRGTIISVM